MPFTSLDIFCHVIDNFGDVGVVYRFAKEFKRANPGWKLRVFIDDLNALRCIHPQTDTAATMQEIGDVTYIDWSALDGAFVGQAGVAEVLVEAFACHIPEAVLSEASRRRTMIINLEYLSAESWVEGYHLKESLLGRGEMRKYFFMPGFTLNTGGVIIDSDVEAVKKREERKRCDFLGDYLKSFNFTLHEDGNLLFGTVFSYDHDFTGLLEDIQSTRKRTCLFVFGDKSIDAMKKTLLKFLPNPQNGPVIQLNSITILFMPFLPQHRYDELLCLADFNIVRGEDSLVRAVLAEKPFIWHAYEQENNYQQVKVKAFLENFRIYFDDVEVYNHYYNLMMRFNDSDFQTEGRRYDLFLADLNKIGHAAKKMSYFIRENCDLVKNLGRFLDQLHDTFLSEKHL